ncbi:MAG: cytochrome c [Nevskia sp.]|nr:cytochrome c [Nevskia sp.]
MARRALVVAFVLGVATPLAAAAAYTLLGLWSVRAATSPPWLEAVLARHALHLATRRQALGVHNPLPDTEDTLAAGMKVYHDNCAGCHGEPGKPSHWGTANLYPAAPQFSDHPSSLSTAQMFLIIKYGVRYSAMGGWDGELKDDDIWRAATFLSRIRTLPPAVATTWNPR